MSAGLKIWLDSGANIHSKNEQILSWDDLGISEEDWDKMKEEEQEAFAKDLAFHYSEWGFVKH